MNKMELIEQDCPQDPEQLEHWCRKYGRLTMFLFITYGLLGVLLATFTPDDILGHAWAKSLIGITASVVPVFLDVPEISPIPDVVRFYFGVMWLLMPVFWVSLVYSVFKWPIPCMSRPKVIEAMKSRAGAVFFYTLAFLFTFLMFYFAIIHLFQPEDGKITRNLFASRLSLATGATLFNFSLFSFAGGMIWMPRAMYHSWKKLPWFYKQRKKSD